MSTSTSTDFNKAGVPFLKGGSNVTEYLETAQGYLEFRGLWGVVSGRLPCPELLSGMTGYVMPAGVTTQPPAASTEDQNTRLAEIATWEAKDESARGFIRLSTDASIRHNYAGLKTSNEMWEKIKTMFDKKDAVDAFNVFCELFEFRMSDDKKVGEQVNQMIRLRGKMAEAGLKLDEHMFSLFVMAATPKRFHSTASNILAGAKIPLDPTFTVDSFLPKLEQEEKFFHGGGTSLSAFRRTSPGSRKKHCDICNRDGSHTTDEHRGPRKDNGGNSGQGGGSSSSKNNFQKKDKDKAKDKGAQSSGQQSGGSSGGKPKQKKKEKGRSHTTAHAFNVIESGDYSNDNDPNDSPTNVPVVVADAFVSLYAVRKDPEDMWMIDSGCNEIVTPHRSDFSSYKEYAHRGKAYLANNSTVEIIGQGTVSLAVRTASGKVNIVNLEKVLYVPAAGIRLMSPQRTLNDGYRWDVIGDKWNVVKNDSSRTPIFTWYKGSKNLFWIRLGSSPRHPRRIRTPLNSRGPLP